MSYSSIFSDRKYDMNQYERNIIVGSLLGDGSLSLYGRSKNTYYREHGCCEQLEYRLWKIEQLKRLDFKFDTGSKTGKIYSPSNPLYTVLYKDFYKDNIKFISKDNIKLLDHPAGLACWYMDDGTLVIDSSKRKDGSIYIFPRLSLCTLSFSKEENEILMNHLNRIFDLNFKLKHRPDGKRYILEVNKYQDLLRFIKLVEPFVKQIPCMNYKIDIASRINDKIKLLKENNKDIEIKIINFNSKDSTYTEKDEFQIINLKKAGVTDKEISKALGRSYWGIVDKIRRLRKESKII